MIDYFFFGKAKEERNQLRAISHFLAKRVRYGRDILPTALLSRLQEARGICAKALGWRVVAGQRQEILAQLEGSYGD